MRAIRTAGSQLRRIFDSSRAPASDVADRLPGIFEDHDLVGPEDDALASGDGPLDAAERHS
jgi:hypothetical protein